MAKHRQPATQRLAIRVGAWNIEWLGTPASRSGPAKRHAQNAEDLAEYILAADVAILGVAEVARNADDGTWTNVTLSAAFRLVEKQTGGRWKHRLFPAHTGRNQLCGIAWDASRVTPIGEARAVSMPDERSAQNKPIWSRPPYGMMFSAGDALTDFVVIMIHMKSNYGGSFGPHRGEEAAALVRDLPSAFTDPDVLIIGDANCAAHDEPAIRNLESAGFVDLNAGDIDTHWRYGPLDRAFVPADQPEFAGRVFDVLDESFRGPRGLSETDFKTRYSDHYMIITEVTVMPDDD